MFTKACLVLIATFLAAFLVSHSQEAAHAQAHIEYKHVRTEVLLTPDGREAFEGQNLRFFRTQDALDEYAKNGWQLVSASFVVETNSGRRTVGNLIFMKK